MQPQPQKIISCSSSAWCAADLALELYTLPFYPQLTVRVEKQRGSEMKKALGILKSIVILYLKSLEPRQGGHFTQGHTTN